MRKILAALSTLACISSAQAQQVERPALHPEDSWTYVQSMERNGISHQREQEFKVIREMDSDMLISMRDPTSNQPATEVLMGADWSRSRDLNGKQTVVARPLDFPLNAGKSWHVDFTENNPNPQITKIESHTTYTVKGWDTVVVPAGSFKAVKVEAEGQWTAELASSNNTAGATSQNDQGSTIVLRHNKVQPRTTTGREYHAFWYVPDVESCVKIVEETYSNNGVLTRRSTAELERYTIAGVTSGQPTQPPTASGK